MICYIIHLAQILLVLNCKSLRSEIKWDMGNLNVYFEENVGTSVALFCVIGSSVVSVKEYSLVLMLLRANVFRLKQKYKAFSH